MHTDSEGVEILSAGNIARFGKVEDCDYDPIRKMALHAELCSRA
jgi:hypothetical protein